MRPPCITWKMSSNQDTWTSSLYIATYWIAFFKSTHCLFLWKCIISLFPLHVQALVAHVQALVALILYFPLHVQALVAQSAANLEEVRFEAISVSARILVRQQCFHQAKSLLRGRIDASSHHPYWHVRLLLQLADISMNERDEECLIITLNKCAEYARQVDAPYTRS